MIFNTLEISDILPLTNDAVAISFAISDDKTSFYEFQHGQFVQLQAEISGEIVTRSYSICAAPYERKLTVAIKRLENGVFSNFANDVLKVGDKLEVSAPQGVFTHLLDSSKKKSYVMAAAGSGITPILSILKMTLASETMSQCTLIYGNTKPESVMFAKDLQKLSDQYPERFRLISVYSQSNAGDFQGRIDLDLVNQIMADGRIDDFFVCGPKDMSVALYDGLCAQGLAKENAHIELFEEAVLSEDSNSSVATVQLSIDGDSFVFDYEDSTRSILDIALDHDPDLPYGCQNGSCGSCQAKVVSGTVEMEVNYALSQSEIDDGMVLVCQARPTSNKVEIDYDV